MGNSFNKSYRIRTEIGKDTNVKVKLDRDYDILEIMSLKINQVNSYKLHTSNYGVIAGRVLANDAFGIPNAKISVFISIDNNDINDVVKTVLYPYNTTYSKDKNGTKYNLLPNEQLNNCHTIIGTFPEKQYVLDNDDILEVFDKYYKYTTRTNNAGDYMIFGVPVGSQTIHVDIDLSDIGILSQKPRDMVYKGYNVEQFENPNKFKHSTNIENLTQFISQDTITDVIPFWGDEDEGSIGITRCDINVTYKFEPTCVFMGSVVSDTASNGISKKCIPTHGMGAMDEMTTGSGTIEMIRKTPSGDVEEFQIKGTQLIDGDGIWCYQIPMNLDYMMTDEFGNMVPTNDPDKGIPTRTRVRFRISMQDFDSDSVNMFRCKMLVPHNPDVYSENVEKELDYNFGTYTNEDSYRDLFWNCVYSVKSYIPRIQKGSNWKNEKFTGFKRVNYYGDKNPIPYNNIRIKLPFMYRILCALVKMYIWVVGFLNKIFYRIAGILVPHNWLLNKIFKSDDEDGDNDEKEDRYKRASYITINGTLCNDSLENMCYVPGVKIEEINGNENNKRNLSRATLLGFTLLGFLHEMGWGNEEFITGESLKDKQSIDVKNKDNSIYVTDDPVPGDAKNERYRYIRTWYNYVRMTSDMSYFIQCIEMNLTNEYKVIQFDFYNDWINGLVYIPRWMRNVSKKRTFLGLTITEGGKIKTCNENYIKNNRNLVQQCGLSFNINDNEVKTDVTCDKNDCHKNKNLRLITPIFSNGGIVYSKKNMINDQYVYYFKPIENSGGKYVRLFATDIILLGTLNDCDKWGIPNNLNQLVSSTYQMPPNLALTNSLNEGDEYVMNKGINAWNYRLIIYDPSNKRNNGNTYKYRGLVKQFYCNEGDCDKGIGKLQETGNYTELSGVNWNYNGPLQIYGKDEMSDAQENFKLYKPGGHFLGLSCVNSETTIKSCINLVRVCEYGVHMSQRDVMDIIGDDGQITTLSTVPTGLVSGNDIYGGEYRSVFATLNSNRLRTKKNKKGFFVYDLKYLKPINFGGELKKHLIEGDESDRFNYYLTKGISEDEYEVLDDDFMSFNKKKNALKNNEDIVRRTNEYFDKEYYKFRFGLDDDALENDNEKKKRYIIENDNGVSFPIYNNSYYFYFGLHDGKTALDEFKKQYYAVCENYGLLNDDVKDKVKWYGLKSSSDGLCDSPNGKIEFELEIQKELLNESNVKIYLYDENEVKKDERVVSGETSSISFEYLSSGNYTIIIRDDNSIYEKIEQSVGKVSIECNLSGVDFYTDVSDKTAQEKLNSDKLENGGYIKLPQTLVFKETENLKRGYPTITVIYSIDIVNKRNERRSVYNSTTGSLRKDKDGDFILPVANEDDIYRVYVGLLLNDECRLKVITGVNNDKLISFLLGEVEIKNGPHYDIKYNNVSYIDVISKYMTGEESLTSKKGWWTSNWHEKEDNFTQWMIKENLYFNNIGTPHKINVNYSGGNPPYTEYVEGMKEDFKTIDNMSPSDFENISIPTINYKNNNNQERYNFSYRFECNNISTPEKNKSPFIFPVIYKPFFMEMTLWFINGNTYLHGNVYNGKTWDYKNEGFNDVYLNDVDLISNGVTINIDDNDNVMSITEPFTSDKGGYEYQGEYFKYNGRKVRISDKITKVIPISYKDSVTLSIGTSHVDDDGDLFTDKCFITIKGCEKYNTFKQKEKEVEGKKFVKFEIEISDTQIPPTNVYYLVNSNDGYEYPLLNGKLNVSDKMFYDLMNDKIESMVETVTVDGEGGYIDISKYKEMNYDRIYCVVISDNNVQTENTSNNENKLKCISVSQMINLNEL